MKQQSVAQRNKVLVQTLKQMAVEQQEIVERLVESVKDKAGKQETLRLLGKLEGRGLRNSTISRFTSIANGQIFKTLKENWEALPEEFTSSYDGDYYAYVQEKYGLGSQMADMYAEVWEGFYSGRYISEKDIPAFVDLAGLPVAKMSTAASYIMRGEMTKNRWKALATKSLNRSALAAALRSDSAEPSSTEYTRSPRGRKTSKMKVVFIQATGDVRAYMPDGSIEQVGVFNINNSNSLILKLIRGILKMCGIKTVEA